MNIIATILDNNNSIDIDIYNINKNINYNKNVLLFKNEDDMINLFNLLYNLKFIYIENCDFCNYIKILDVFKNTNYNIITKQKFCFHIDYDDLLVNNFNNIKI